MLGGVASGVAVARNLSSSVDPKAAAKRATKGAQVGNGVEWGGLRHTRCQSKSSE